MNLILSPSGNTIAVPHDPTLVNILETKPVQINGQDMLATPYTKNVHKLLKALGSNIAPPFTLQYSWPAHFTPFNAQRKTAELLTTEERAYVLNEMGTGKTIAALAAADWLIQKGAVQRVLIVSPLSTLALVWAREIFSFCPWHRSSILHGTADARRQKLDDLNTTIYIINHDGLYIVADEIMNRPDINLLIIDELAEYRSGKGRRWNALHDVSQCIEYVWGLTGTPIPNEPVDAWGQAKIVTPKTVPMHYTAFRYLTMYKDSMWTWREKPDALETVHKVMTPAVRFKRAECVDMPPVTYSARSVEIPPKIRRAYNDMLKVLRHEATSGTITAANEGVKLGKLLQISAGYVYDDGGNVVKIGADARLNLLKEIIDEANTKVIVLAMFVHAMDAIQAFLRNKKISAELVRGSTSANERTRIFNDFCNAPDPRVLIAHPGVMSHGLNFQHVATTVWYTPYTSNNRMQQADNRMTRPGQKNPMHIIRFIGTNVEQRIYARVDKKQTLQGLLLEMFEGGD